MSTSSRSFCRFLDHGLAYNNDTVNFTVSPCCYFSETYTLQPNLDLDQQINQHRRRWLSQDWNETCRVCLDQERAGIPSYRQASFNMVPEQITGVAVATVAVTKQCNLACASCGPHASSYWYQQNRRDGVFQTQMIADLHREDRIGTTAQRFASVFGHEQFRDLRYIKFGGGEPLMNSTHEKILAAIPDPSLVTLQYTSNFSIAPSTQVLDLWARFRLVKWCASIDGTQQQFELLRWPYRWQDLERMIDQQFHRVPHNVMFGVEHTLNPLNIWYFDRFEAWFDERFSANRYGDASDLNLHCCVAELGLDQTPPLLRDAVGRKLGDDHPVTLLLHGQPYRGHYTEMTKWLDQLDQRRDTKWRDVFLEVADYFS
jgi:hypothetical protein